MRRLLSSALLLCSAGMACAQQMHEGWPSRKTEPVNGPDGLSGWTVEYRLPDEFAQYKDEYEPMTLVIARKGQPIREIEGEPFLWAWKFWDGGRQVAVERGPKHFGMSCSLLDVETGRELQRVDCFSEPGVDTPAWARAVLR